MKIPVRQAVACLCAISIYVAATTEQVDSQTKNSTTPGYRLAIEVERVDSLRWEALVELENAGPVAALTLPLKWGNGRSPFRLDSANYLGARTEYFALKTLRVDSTKQTLLIGMISDLGGSTPPLEPGDGAIVTLHFSTRRPTSSTLTLDTTFVAPHNVLQLVSPDVRAIRPEFERSTDSATNPR